MYLSRRRFIGCSIFSLCAGAFGLPRIALASAPTDKRLVFIFLRGGLDGLFAVPPYGDPDFAKARTELAVPSPDTEGGALKLNGMFGLHPSLANMHQLYLKNQLTVFHAIASPYRERSHFDAQNILENGMLKPHLRESGWLNAALLSMNHANHPLGIALGNSVPLVLQGNAEVTSWAPSKLPEPALDITDRLARLYANDPQLKEALFSAKAAQDEMAQSHEDPKEQMAASGGETESSKLMRQAFVAYMKAAGKFLGTEDGPRVATVDLSGFDSHHGQTSANSTLVKSLTLLDTGLEALRQQLGNAWGNTAIFIVTEFGRTVAMNGSQGSDHGTATVAFLAGGAVAGGKIIADWPGLSANRLYEGRDLYPTTDLRRIEMAVLRDHLGIAESALHQDIFPDSNNTQPYQGLFA